MAASTRSCVRSSLVLALPLAACGLAAAPLAAGESRSPSSCGDVGGTVMTNFIDENTTLGVATGDLAGAVSADLLGVAPGADNTTVFTVQHHWTTANGDTVGVEVAQATATQIAPGLFAILSYPIPFRGGTGRFAGANGLVKAIGVVDLTTQRTIFRYAGRLCTNAAR